MAKRKFDPWKNILENPQKLEVKQTWRKPKPKTTPESRNSRAKKTVLVRKHSHRLNQRSSQAVRNDLRQRRQLPLSAQNRQSAAAIPKSLHQRRQDRALGRSGEGLRGRKEHFLIFDKKELDAVKPESDRRIRIDKFVDFFCVDPIYFYSTYALMPDKSNDAYNLLLQRWRRKAKPAQEESHCAQKNTLQSYTRTKAHWF